MARAKTTPLVSDMTAPPLREVVELAGDDKAKYQAWFEDRVVRAVREEGHCSEALRIMDRVFGRPLDTVGVYDSRGMYAGGARNTERLVHAYLDSDGKDCWGNEWRDSAGFDRAGYNADGRDKDGFDIHGFDIHGFDREGNDAAGVHKDSPDRFKFDIRGYDREGFNSNGFDRNGWNREGKNTNGEPRSIEDPFAFDVAGYDKDGYNVGGYNRAGEYNEAKARTYSRYGRGSRDGLRF